MTKRAGVISCVFVFTFLLAGVAGAQSGLKLADKLVKRAQDTTSAIRTTNLQVKKTLEHYNYIIDGKADDPRSEYKKLGKELDKTLKQREDVRTKAQQMQAAADKYFADWETNLAGFSSEEMRAKSESQLADTRENYNKIFEAGSKAGADFDSFIEKMNDQIRFLGQNLNPAAIADLKDEAAALNKQGDSFFQAITETLKTATDYTESLKP